MPTYQLTSPRTGRTYGVQSAAELPDDDIDALVNDLDFEAAREAGVQPGVDPAVLQQGPVGSFLQSIPQTFAKVGSGMISGAGRILDKASESLSQATGLPKGGDMFQRMADYGDELSTSADLTFPTNPQNPVAGTIGSGAAQGLSLLVGGLAGKALTGSNVAMTAVPAVSGFLSGANQGIQTAEEIGVQSPLAQLGTGMAFGGLEVLTERLGGIGSRAGTEALTRAVRQTAGQMLKSAGKAVGIEALEEVLAGRSQAALTRLIASEDPNNPGFTRTGVNLDTLASEIVNLEAMKLEALGGAAGGTVFAGVQALANRQLPNDPTTSPNQTPAPTQPPAPGQPGAPAPMGAGPPGPAAVSPLIGIAQRGGAVDVTLPDDTGELTAEEVADLDQVPGSMFQVSSSETVPTPGAGAIRPQPGASRVTEEGSIPSTAPQAAQRVISTGRPNGAQVSAVIDFVEAADLEPLLLREVGTDQTRDRANNRGSSEQIASIATSPDAQLLGDSPVSSLGAPVVDDVILAGNGRAEGLLQGYRSGGAGIANYRQQIVQQAAAQGRTDVAGMKQPVMIRRVTGYVRGDRRSFVTESNPKYATLQETVAEAALLDAEVLGDLSGIEFTQSGQLTSSSLQQVATKLKAAQRGINATTGGKPDVIEGTRRVQLAALAKLATDNGVDVSELSGLLETDTGRRAIAEVTKAAPRLAALDADLGLGDVMLSALRSFSEGARAVSQGIFKNLTEWADNRGQELIRDELSPEAGQILEVMIETVRTPTKLRELFDTYLEAATNEQDQRNQAAGTNDIFGDARTNVPGTQILGRELAATTDATPAPAERGSGQSAGSVGQPRAEPAPLMLPSNRLGRGLAEMMPGQVPGSRFQVSGSETVPTPGAGAIRPQPGASRVTAEGSIPSTALSARAAQWWASTSRAEAQAILEPASLEELKAIAVRMDENPNQPKAKLINRLVQITGVYSDALGIRGADAVGPRGPMPDYTGRTAEAQQRMREQKAARAQQPKEQGLPKKAKPRTPEEFARDMAALMTTPGRQTVGTMQNSADLATAYTTAARGQSSQMIPLAEVFAAARQQNPALTPAQFQAQVMAEYDRGSVMLEGAGSPQEAQSAALRIDGTPVGSAVRMMVVGNPALQNPASRETGLVKEINGVPAAEIFASAKKRHGITNDINEAGYVLPDGTMLDFSGRADAGYVQGPDLKFRPKPGERDWMKGERGVDHREIEWTNQPEYRETWQPMVEFMRLGAVRMSRAGAMISMHGRFMPTSAQLRVLKALVTQEDGAYLDLEDTQGQRAAITLESGKFAKLQGLIRRWANGENLDEVQQVFNPAELAANQKANEAILRNLGLPTAKGTRTWGGKKIQGALRKLAQDERYPATTRRMAQELAARPLDNLLLKIEADARLNWAGLYQPFNNGRGELSLNTRTLGRGELDIGISLVHEVLHHATYRALENPQTAKQKQAKADLEALFKRAKAALAANEQFSEFDYELSNLDEFISGLWTRADFQTALAGIPAEAAPTLGQRVRSVLDEIFRVLSELVTGKAVPPGSVLEASMAATLRIMEDGRTEVEMEAMLAPLQNPASNIQQPAAPNETQSRFASPNPADRVINGPRTDELVTAEADAWLNSLDQQAAIEAFVAGQVPLSLDTAERAAATLIANLSEQAATAKTEMARMWAHVQGRRMARVWTTEHLSADPARALRQRGVVNNTILAPIAPVLAAQELLEDRAKKVIDQRFDGGTEGAVEKVKDIATTAGEQAGTDLAADLEGETTPGAPTRPGQPPRPRKLAAKHPNLKKMLDALRKKMFPGMTWADIFTQLPETQKARQREIYRRLMLDERLRNLTPEERLALTNELDKAWLRERRKVFMRELEKAGVLGEEKPKDREKVKAAAPRLLRLMNLGMLNSEMFREALAKEYGLNMIDAAAAADLRALGERIQKAPEGLPRRKLEQQLVERLQKLSGYTLWQVMDSWWTASVLSGWRTPVDIGLGVANGMEDIGLGSIVAALRSGNKDVAVRGLAALFGRIPSAFMEAVDHVATGNKAMMRSFELEVKQAMEGGNLLASDVGRQMWDRGGWRKVPGGFMVFYGRLMTALDHVNSASTREGAKALALARHPDLYQKALRISDADRAAARQQARLELTGGAVPATQQERIEEAARVREILEQGIPAEVLAEATEVGRAAALQGEPTGLGGALLDAVLSAVSVVNRKAQELANRPNPDRLTRQGAAITAAMVPMARAITGTKFARTVAHSINRTASYVPGLGAYAVGQQGRTGAFGDILAAKQVIGTLVGIALYLAFDDDDDEKGIEDSWKDKTPQQKAQLYAQGKQPFTIWTRDDQGRVRNWNYQQWGVAGIVNTVAAMLKQKGSEAGTLNVLMSSITQGAMSFTDKAQLQGLQTVFDENFRSTDPASGIAASLNKWAAQTVGGVVPRLVKDIDMVASPELRDTSEWWQKWAKEVPMLRQLSSGKRIDILGQDIKLDRGPLSRVTQLGTADPVYRMLGNLNARDVWLPDPSQGVRVVKFSNGTRRNMNPQEKDRYQRLTGAAYRAYLEKEGPALLQMSPEDAQEAVSKATARLRATAAYQATH